MARFPFANRSSLSDHARQLTLATYRPVMELQGLLTGVDNLRHDVFLSPKFALLARAHISRVIAQYGNIEDMVAEEAIAARPPSIMMSQKAEPRARGRGADAAEFKLLLSELQIPALNRAKAESNISIDLLARLAILKFLRSEVSVQFSNLLERCRAKVKSHEGPRQAGNPRALQLRERAAVFQLSKKPILRKVGQELFETLREVEKETLARTRRSLLGEAEESTYELFLNRLLFTEDGRDDFINAEHYVMLGNYERDPDRFLPMREITCGFLRSAGIASESDDDEEYLDLLLNVPENAQELMGGGSPDEDNPKFKAQKVLLEAWLEMLENENVIDHVIASYEVVPLLAEYSPPINPQQLKNALISRTERKRVERLLEEHGKLSPDNLNAAVRRVAGCRGSDRSKLLGRFLGDFIRYHRDLRRLEAVNGAMDSINVIGNEKLKELSAINNRLYEFLLPEEQKPSEDKVIHHIILKADIRDSSALTRTLFERGLNPASYFSLNFYEPVNKLLPKYGASKVFIEGDAVILALFEREGETVFGVGRACVLAKEIVQIVRGYNELSQKSGLPVLELGIGIAYQDTAPMYLMDGSSHIMISSALNISDRLSSCSRSARKLFAGVESIFNVFCFQTIDDADTAGQPDEFLMRYNIGGINIQEPAFYKLQQEISLELHEVPLPTLWGEDVVRLYKGVVPVAAGVFHPIIVREACIPHIEAREFQLKDWTDRRYYEVCTNGAIYEYLDNLGTQSAVMP